tara:strand:- start:1117 stop:1815 length:699 start_codon:yes stop_codon:yes gene_type:complete
MNALSGEMIQETTHVFNTIGEDESIRVVILEGNGKTFSAGADLSYMKQSGEMNIEQNTEQGIRLGNMYRSIEQCPKPVIAKAHGYAIGGGFGFMALADIAIAETNTKFSLSEVKLGINPAVIGPFVIKKIGLSHFKSLGISGEMIDTNYALRIGLIHEIADEDELETAVINKVNLLLKAGPNAIAEFKANCENMNEEEAAARIAILRSGEEGQEGLAAFLEKRIPNWAESID